MHRHGAIVGTARRADRGDRAKAGVQGVAAEVVVVLIRHTEVEFGSARRRAYGGRHVGRHRLCVQTEGNAGTSAEEGQYPGVDKSAAVVIRAPGLRHAPVKLARARGRAVDLARTRRCRRQRR
eukprot:6101874-Prymnesium_polylepis.1